MSHIFFIHWSADGHLGCSHVLTIANSAAMNFGVHVSFWIMVFSGICPGVRLLNQMVVLFVVFFFLGFFFFLSKAPILFSIVATQIYIPNNKAGTPVLWPPHAKSWLIGKDSDAGRDLGAGGEGDDRGWDGWMASLTLWTWVWTLGVGDGQGGLACCDSGGRRVGHDWATELNWMVWEVSLLSTPLQHLVFVDLLSGGILTGMRW